MPLLPLLIDLKQLCKEAPQQIASPCRYCSAGQSLPFNQFQCCQRFAAASSAAQCCSPVGQGCFHVSIDVRDFYPNEVAIQALNNTILVEGRHEERSDGQGFVARSFTRRYVLPNGYNVKDMLWSRLSNGLLVLEVPFNGYYQIQRPGPPYNVMTNWRSTNSTPDFDENEITGRMARMTIN